MLKRWRRRKLAIEILRTILALPRDRWHDVILTTRRRHELEAGIPQAVAIAAVDFADALTNELERTRESPCAK